MACMDFETMSRPQGLLPPAPSPSAGSLFKLSARKRFPLTPPHFPVTGGGVYIHMCICISRFKFKINSLGKRYKRDNNPAKVPSPSTTAYRACITGTVLRSLRGPTVVERSYESSSAVPNASLSYDKPCVHAIERNK